MEERRLGRRSSVIFRMVRKYRKRKAGVRDHIMVKVGETMRPYWSPRDAMIAAEAVRRKVGMPEDELLKYMTRNRIIAGEDQIQQVIVPFYLHQLCDFHRTDKIIWLNWFVS